MTNRKMNVTLALSLTTMGVAAAGCVAEIPETQSKAPAEESQAATFAASPETTAASGITTWTVVMGETGVWMEGTDASGAVVNSIHLDVVVEKDVVDGVEYDLRVFEVTTSGGGLLRTTEDGQVLEVQPDPIGFDALSRDIAPYMSERDDLAPYKCDAWGWGACYVASAAAGVACATPPWIQCTLAVAAMAATCGPCWMS